MKQVGRPRYILLLHVFLFFRPYGLFSCRRPAGFPSNSIRAILLVSTLLARSAKTVVFAYSTLLIYFTCSLISLFLTRSFHVLPVTTPRVSISTYLKTLFFLVVSALIAMPQVWTGIPHVLLIFILLSIHLCSFFHTMSLGEPDMTAALLGWQPASLSKSWLLDRLVPKYLNCITCLMEFYAITSLHFAR